MLPPLDHPCKDCGRQRVNDTSPRILGYDIEGKRSAIPDVGDHTVYGTTQSEQAAISRYTAPPTPSDLRAVLDELCEAVGEFQDVSDAWAKSTAETYQMEYAQKAVNAARLAVEALFEKQQAEIGARGKLYGEMCGILHDCCQKYKLGLGGENIAELVTEEVSHLRSENGALRARSSLPSLIQALKIADLESSSLTPAEAKSLVVLARNEARQSRETPEWDTWLNLADKLTRIADKPQ
jgi:hypothetical protein